MENLWKKERYGDGSMIFVDLYENVRVKRGKVKQTDAKNNATADEYRRAGNRLFQQGEFIAAMDEYNKGLCYAERASESMSLAYANRAICFLRLRKYDHCLADIELAIAANYPERLMPKLVQRKADCVQQMRAAATIEVAEARLSYAADARIPFVADVLEFRHTGAFGRHVVAKCDIAAGKTVMVEPTYLAMTENDRPHCATCQTFDRPLVPCDKCTMTMYCSDACLADGRSYHEVCCGHIHIKTGHIGIGQRIGLHLVFGVLDTCNGSVDALMAFVEEARAQLAGVPTSLDGAQAKYRFFLQLHAKLASAGTLDGEMDRAFVYRHYKIVMALPKMHTLFDTLAKQRFLMHLLTMHWSIMVRNVHRANAYNKDMLYTLGLAASMFNHQCWPNVVRITAGGKELAITVRPILAGEQLFVLYAAPPNVEQREGIFQDFGFWCECSKCFRRMMSALEGRIVEVDARFEALHRNSAPSRLRSDVANRATTKANCVVLLTEYGGLAYNDQVAFLVHVFKYCVMCDFGYGYNTFPIRDESTV